MRLTFKNYATEPWMQDFAGKMCPQLLRETRLERKTLDTRWMHFWRMHQAELDQPSYLGRSQVYFSAARRAVETWVTALMEALFPQTDWFKVRAKQGVGDPFQVPRWTALQRHFLDQMELEDQFPLFLRDFGTFGNAFLRHTWDVQEEPQRVWERQLKGASLDTEADERRIREEADDQDEDDILQQQDTIFRLVEKTVTTYAGPIIRPVSPFHLFVAPKSARSLKTATAVFEDLEVPFTHVEQMHERWMDPEQPAWGRVYDHPDWELITAAKGILTNEMIQRDTERWQRLGFDFDTNRTNPTLSAKGNTQLTELMWTGQIPNAVDETGIPFGIRNWHFVILNDCFVVRAHPNLTYGNILPWIDARMYRTTGSFYAQGIMDAIASPQMMMNDIGNLTIDNLVMALSPPVAIDQNMVVDPESLEWAPGAKWFGDGPPGQWVQPLTIPTQAQLGMSMLGLMSGLVQDQSGANFAVQAVTPPRGKGRAGQTAAGMSQYLGQGSQEILGFAKSIERQVFDGKEGILARNYQLTEQFSTEKVIIQRLGIDGAALITEEVGVEDILGSYAYEWRGATSVRERGMLLGTLQQLPQMLVSLAQFDPSLPQAFDAKEYLRLMLVDVANIPWAETLFKTPVQGASIDPRLEHEAFILHRKAEPHPADDDMAHLEGPHGHLRALQTMDEFGRDPIARQLLMAHIDATVQQIQAKQQAQQQAMMMQQQAMMQGPPGPPQGPPGQGSPPAGMPEAAGPALGPEPPGPPQMMQ
jgi:hypothetical protein